MLLYVAVCYDILLHHACLKLCCFCSCFCSLLVGGACFHCLCPSYVNNIYIYIYIQYIHIYIWSHTHTHTQGRFQLLGRG